MPRTNGLTSIDAFAALAAFGQQVLDLVKESGLAKPPRRKRTDATPRRKRRTKAEMEAARLAAAQAQEAERRPARRQAVPDDD